MKKSKSKLRLAWIALAAVMIVGLHSAGAQGTKFTYQGRLLDAGSPASGIYDLRFTVWDSAGGGLQIGAAVTVAPVSVSSGLFIVPLDFGGAVFTGPARWLQIESRLFGGGAYSLISARQELTAAPYAIAAGSLTGPLPAGQLSGTVPDPSLSANVALLNRNPQTFTGQNSFNNNVGIGTSSPGARLDVNGDTIHRGDLSFTDPAYSILFPATAAANSPMMYMFASGTQNADRMVIGHSPSYPDWGLQYSDALDRFHFLGSGTAAMTVDLASHRVGIGTTNPGAKLDVNGDTIHRGDLSFTDPAYSITFPATPTTTNSPMIYMFASGTGNADRMVIAHSPSYPSWGLQYEDVGDRLNFLSGGTAVMTVDLANQRVGIGTTPPTRAKFEINGTSGSYAYGQRGILNSAGAISSSSTGNDANASFWASGNCWGSAFLAFSDERIKRIEGRSDAAHDLATLLGIEVTDYTYIDTVAKSAGKQKKVIAQQVEKVYPQAVSRNTDAVPDIYKMAEVRNGWVKLATNLKKGERVRLIGTKKEGVHEVLEVTQDKFRTDFTADGAEVFVFGREVKDFRSVDYEAIAMLNVSATQELSRRLEKQAAELSARDGKIAALEKANQEMQRELAAQKDLASRVQAEFVTLRKAVARLADKSAGTFALNQSPAEAQ